jgi:hypothetical protein
MQVQYFRKAIANGAVNRNNVISKIHKMHNKNLVVVFRLHHCRPNVRDFFVESVRLPKTTRTARRTKFIDDVPSDSRTGDEGAGALTIPSS